MARESIERMAEAQGMTYGECHAQQCALLPTGKMSTPEEMAEAVAWLMSPGQNRDDRAGRGREQRKLDGMKNSEKTRAV